MHQGFFVNTVEFASLNYNNFGYNESLPIRKLLRRSRQNDYDLRAFEFGHIITSPIATFLRRSAQIILFVKNSRFRPGGAAPLGVVCLFSRVTRVSNKNIHSSIYHLSYMEPLFVVAKIMVSPGKNNSQLFHSKRL